MLYDNLHSLEAEAAVLASMILSEKCIPDIIGKIPSSDYFFEDKHRIIYHALTDLFCNNEPTDGLAVRTKLKEQGKLEVAGGEDYLGKILESVPTAANAKYYAGIVAGKKRERDFINTSVEVAALTKEHLPLKEKIQKAQELILTLDDSNQNTETIDTTNAVEVLISMRDDNEKILPTDFRDLDKLLHGFLPGEVIILAGRPSMGKSGLALDIALNAARNGAGALFSTLEMPPHDVIKRAGCSLAGVSADRVRNNETTTEESERLLEAGELLQRIKFVLSTAGNTPEKLYGLIKRYKQTHNLGLVIVDYLQLMGGHKRENRQQEVSTISRKLKQIALSENIPILILSQLNRLAEERTNHRPKLSDLRDSGSLEQDADIVLLLYRDDYYYRDETPNGICEINIAKNRRGKTGRVDLVFLDEIVKFGSLAYE